MTRSSAPTRPRAASRPCSARPGLGSRCRGSRRARSSPSGRRRTSPRRCGQLGKRTTPHRLRGMRLAADPPDAQERTGLEPRRRRAPSDAGRPRYSTIQWSRPWPGWKYVAKPHRALAAMPRWRSNAQLSTAKWRHVPTTRTAGSRGTCSGAGSSARSAATIAAAGRMLFEANRSGGSPRSSASCGWMTRLWTGSQMPSRIGCNPRQRGRTDIPQ